MWRVHGPGPSDAAPAQQRFPRDVEAVNRQAACEHDAATEAALAMDDHTTVACQVQLRADFQQLRHVLPPGQTSVHVNDLDVGVTEAIGLHLLGTVAAALGHARFIVEVRAHNEADVSLPQEGDKSHRLRATDQGRSVLVVVVLASRNHRLHRFLGRIPPWDRGRHIGHRARLPRLGPGRGLADGVVRRFRRFRRARGGLEHPGIDEETV
mmetsp:Transcript_151602/g.486462  ORF Transcript_151602/g.486462 Transcript_151602/m.486462 type:complete len:210 (+) Transcript_151602:294-923(+)